MEAIFDNIILSQYGGDKLIETFKFGVNDAYVILDETKMRKLNFRVACVSAPEDKVILINVDKYYMAADFEIQKFIIAHELGHVYDIVNNNTSIKGTGFFKRYFYILLGKIAQREYFADSYANKITDAFSGLQYLLKCTGLLGKREIRCRIKKLKEEE
jgi:hypothetical protein